MFKSRIGRALLIVTGICVWFYLIYRYPTVRLLTLLLLPVIVINFSKTKRLRDICITVFVIIWLILFHYESTRHFYLNTLAQRDLPKTKFLFPPAGWIMFFNVDETYSYVEVYGKMGEDVQLVDPHDIFRTRTIGFDNIHRNVLSAVGSRALAAPFCRYLAWRLPAYQDFVVTAVYYPSLVKEPAKRWQQVLYQCGSPQGQ